MQVSLRYLQTPSDKPPSLTVFMQVQEHEGTSKYKDESESLLTHSLPLYMYIYAYIRITHIQAENVSEKK